MIGRHPFVRNYLPMRNADFSSRVVQTANAHNHNNGVDCGRRLVILAALLFVAGLESDVGAPDLSRIR